MKKNVLNLIIPFLFIFIFTNNTNAQTYTVGTDNGINGAMVYPSPFGDYYKNMRTQHLYLASELTAAGLTPGFITDISWNVVALPGTVGPTEDYTIKLLTSVVSSLGLTTWEAGASTVWGPTTYTPNLGINNFTLDVPFFWDGVSNLIVEICGGNPAGEFTKNARVTWSGPLPFNASHTQNSDVDFLCAYTGPLYYEADPGGPDYRPQVNFTQAAAPDCAVIPAMGAATTTDANVCVGEGFTLSVPAVLAIGVAYQWLRSTDGVIFSNIPGAVTSSYSTTQTASTYYKCKVTCTLSGDNEFSGAVLVNQNDPLTCYCVPTYTNGTPEGDYVSHVVIGGINNVTGALPAPYYNYYNALTANVTKSTTYTINISAGSYLTNNGLAAWIDYNQDGTFSASEKLGEVTGLAAFGTANITFTVPGTALVGVTRLRVRDAWNTIGMTACDEYGYGETEDYNIDIHAPVAPTSSFSFTGDPVVAFTDLSTGVPTSWAWNFGDGGTSALQNPTHSYLTNGVFNVCLVATNAIGSNISCQNVTIDSYLSPVSSFTYSGDPTVSFNDNSTNSPTSWFWYFDDGTTSTLENPVHTYASNGLYNVCLTATNGVGSNTSCQNVLIDSYLSPTALFSHTGDPNVSFTDLSTNTPTSWAWDFGDAGTSALQNPNHTYAVNGTFNVCLTATNVIGSNTHCEDVVINSYVYTPVADFSFTGDPSVSYTDLSSNIPTSWSWDFDDGATSTLQNPTHNYIADGTYNVCLTATNIAGSNMICKDVIIGSFPSPVANFIFSGDPNVTFADLTTNSPFAWDWDFDDGTTSTVQNPIHFFPANGIYHVCLTATAAGGSSTYCSNVTINTLGSAPITDYTYTESGLTLFFTDISTNDPSDWLWQFGDGAISGLQNPSHSFATLGEYNVCLTAVNDYGSNDKCSIINVAQVGINQILTATLNIYPNPVEDYTTIVIPETLKSLNGITIYNAIGQIIPIAGLISTSGNNNIVLQTKTFIAGSYIIKIIDGDKIYMGQFVKN